MDEPFAVVVRYIRKQLYNEKQHLKELIIDQSDNNYIQFKKGKIFQLELNINNILELKNQWYKRAKESMKP